MDSGEHCNWPFIHPFQTHYFIVTNGFTICLSFGVIKWIKGWFWFYNYLLIVLWFWIFLIGLFYRSWQFHNLQSYCWLDQGIVQVIYNNYLHKHGNPYFSNLSIMTWQRCGPSLFLVQHCITCLIIKYKSTCTYM